MSYLEHFLKETTSSTRHGSVDSVEGDIEDNRAPSITSSKSNLSELSIVSILQYDGISGITRDYRDDAFFHADTVENISRFMLIFIG